jgi:hypothetical protein
MPNPRGISRPDILLGPEEEGNVTDKSIHLLKNGVVFAFVASLLAGFFLPVYTDEIGWRFQERAALDGVDKLASDMCGPNTLAVPPWFMMPVRYFSAILNTTFADPIFVRLSGIGYALLWGFLLLRLIQLLAKDGRDRDVLAILACGLMGLGWLPLLLIWSRPEQPILLALTTALIVTFSGQRDAEVPTTAFAAWRRSIGVLLCALITVSYHVKGLVLFPIYILCIVFASSGRKAILPRVAATTALVAMELSSALYWVHRLECPGDKVLAAKYASHNLGLTALAGGQWFSQIGSLLQNLNPTVYFMLAAPRSKPMSMWLEYDQLSSTSTWIWCYVLAIIWLTVVIAGFFCSVSAAQTAWRERKPDLKLLFAAGLFGTTMAWAATQVIRNDYDASFVLPLVMLACLMAVAAPVAGSPSRTEVRRIAVPLGLIALVSPLMVAGIYGPSLARAFEARGYLSAQPHSVPVLGYQDQKRDIMAAARLCRIPTTRRPRDLMIDELTYFAFMESYRQQQHLGVIGVWKGGISDPIQYLKKVGSDGFIVGCNNLTESLRRKSVKVGNFCCQGAQNW